MKSFGRISVIYMYKNSRLEQIHVAWDFYAPINCAKWGFPAYWYWGQARGKRGCHFSSSFILIKTEKWNEPNSLKNQIIHHIHLTIFFREWITKSCETRGQGGELCSNFLGTEYTCFLLILCHKQIKIYRSIIYCLIFPFLILRILLKLCFVKK